MVKFLPTIWTGGHDRQVLKEEGEVVASWRADGAGNCSAREGSVPNLANGKLRQVRLDVRPSEFS